MIVTMTLGLPASGKSTWAKQQIGLDHNTKRINKDDLRSMIDNDYHSDKAEKTIIGARNVLLKEFLDRGHDVIIDDTNISPKHIRAVQEIIKEFNKTSEVKAELKIKSFVGVSKNECIARDQHREKGVGSKVIGFMNGSLTKNLENGEYDEFITLDEKKTFLEKPKENMVSDVKDYYIPFDDKKGKCILVDIDGTFAMIHGRSPFDVAKSMNDVVNPIVQEMVMMYYRSGYKIFFITGRSDKYKDITSKYLSDNGINLDEMTLYMRPHDDQRSDTIIKQEIVEKNVLPFYNVHLALEDRDRVVKMYRNMGIRCFQVKDGNY